jgi:dolichol kinase
LKTKEGHAGHEDWLGEDSRQVVHAAFGAAVMIAVVMFGKDFALTTLFSLFCVFLLMVSWSMMGRRNPLFDLLMRRFERKVDIPGKGALMYSVGVMFILTFSSSLAFALAGIGILAFGDAISTMVGIRGKRRLPWNAKKTWEGLAGFVVASAIVAFPLIGWIGVAYGLLLGVVETLPTDLDDNLLISVCAVLMNLILK